MIVVVLAKLFVYAKLAFRSKDLSIHIVGEDIPDLINYLLNLRMSAGTVN